MGMLSGVSMELQTEFCGGKDWVHFPGPCVSDLYMILISERAYVEMFYLRMVLLLPIMILILIVRSNLF